MNDTERHPLWEKVYQTKGERDVSWYEESPRISLDFIRATGVGNDANHCLYRFEP
jgi:hypothetical protein